MGPRQAEIAHVSKFKRAKGSLGGVEKFASHLKRVFPKLRIYASDDAPPRDYGSELALAKALNQHLLDTGEIGKKTIAICDGFWQAGLKGNVKATVNVAHGTYAGCAMANEFHRFGQTADYLKLARWQEGAYRAADVVVAVSPLTAWELKTFYRLDSVVILNGVDLGIFKPDGKGMKILHAASPGRKQLGMVEAVAGMIRRPIQHINIRTGNEEDEAAKWQQGMVAFFPSLYEGCAYSGLEAMACGLVPVSYKTGIFWGLPDWAAIEVTDHYRLVYAEAILEAISSRDKFHPRKWIEENASFNHFAAGWKGLIKSLR
jgi:glycosyltransferase involved in cell wall biosynthesis